MDLPPSDSDSAQRSRLGWAAMALLAAAMIIPFVTDGRATSAQIQGACIRVGLIVGAWWLAYDQLRRLPKWLLVIAPAVILLAAANKRFFPLALVLILAGIVAKLGRFTRGVRKIEAEIARSSPSKADRDYRLDRAEPPRSEDS